MSKYRIEQCAGLWIIIEEISFAMGKHEYALCICTSETAANTIMRALQREGRAV